MPRPCYVPVPPAHSAHWSSKGVPATPSRPHTRAATSTLFTSSGRSCRGMGSGRATAGAGGGGSGAVAWAAAAQRQRSSGGEAGGAGARMCTVQRGAERAVRMGSQGGGPEGRHASPSACLSLPPPRASPPTARPSTTPSTHPIFLAPPQVGTADERAAWAVLGQRHGAAEHDFAVAGLAEQLGCHPKLAARGQLVRVPQPAIVARLRDQEAVLGPVPWGGCGAAGLDGAWREAPPRGSGAA